MVDAYKRRQLDTVVGFGKYHSKKIRDINPGYLEWASKTIREEDRQRTRQDELQKQAIKRDKQRSKTKHELFTEKIIKELGLSGKWKHQSLDLLQNLVVRGPTNVITLTYTHPFYNIPYTWRKGIYNILLTCGLVKKVKWGKDDNPVLEPTQKGIRIIKKYLGHKTPTWNYGISGFIDKKEFADIDKKERSVLTSHIKGHQYTKPLNWYYD